MKTHKIQTNLLCLIVLSLPLQLSFAEKMPEGTSRVDFHGYKNCVQLKNNNTEVVLSHQAGGRVIQYALNGENSLYLEKASAGANFLKSRKLRIDGGRFDIGPEKIVPPRMGLFKGPWTVEITGPRKARMISEENESTGVQLIRDFELAPDSSKLSCTQIIKNISNETKYYCHWSRTLAVGDGICLIPLTRPTRFPKDYIMYEGDKNQFLNYKPEDPNIRTRDGFLEILGTPRKPKLGMDSQAGWFCYLTKSDLLFLKRYPVYPDRVYNEMAALTISIYYKEDYMCELEPIGPQEIIQPGESASFTEQWWLLPYSFPKDRNKVNLPEIQAIVDKTR